MAEIENLGSTAGRDGKNQETRESLAGIVISHAKTLDMRKRRKEFEESVVSDKADYAEGGRKAPGDVASEDWNVEVSESLKHVRSCDFHFGNKQGDPKRHERDLEAGRIQKRQQQVCSQGPEGEGKTTEQECICPSMEP